MEASEIKGLLKQAKGLLAKGDKAQDALIILRTVLKQDPENYQALVLEGAGLQQIGKAAQGLASYKKAIAVNPKQVLAWQGVVSHYEKKGIKEHEDLIEAYKNISNYFEKDEDKSKYLDATLKFVGQLQSQSLFPQCIRVLQRLIKSNGTNIKISQVTVGILGQMGSLQPADEALYLVCLSNLHETSSSTDEQYRKYFQLLYKEGNYRRLEEVCRDLNPRFNSFYYPLDYLCRLYVEKELSPEGVELVPSFVEKLFKLYPSSSFGSFAQGKIYYEAGLPLEAITWLRQATDSKIHEEGIHLLILALGRIWDWEGVEEYATKILKEGNLKDRTRFYLALANSLLQQKKVKEAWGVVEKLEELTEEAGILKGLIYWEEGRVEEFQDLCSQLQDWRLELCHLRGKEKTQESALLQLLEKYPDNFDLLLTVGIWLSEMSAFDAALRVYQQCLCLFKDHPILLTHLAQLFIEEEEYTTALSYLKSAYKTLPSPQIGMHLSDLYFKMGENDANQSLLKQATKKLKKSKSKWAWLRLGMLYLELNDPAEAVSALQSAIRTDIGDCHVWETLAEAYYARGSYDASLKAFEQCLKLGAEPTYPKFKVGVIQRHLGEEEEAIATLSELRDYSPAILELSKTHLQIAKKRYKEGLNVAVVTALNATISSAAKVMNSPEQILGLSIITDAIILGGELNPNSVFSIPSSLLQAGSSKSQFQNVTFRELLLLGLRTATTVCKNSESTHLIAFQHFAMGKIYLKLSQKLDMETLERALYHGKKAVSLNQSNYSYWNTLGIIAEAAGERSLALHAYLTSIQKNPTGSAATWTNLGLCLHSTGHFLEAHRCFTQAQRFEPSYGVAWIGQGLVAESLAEQDEWTDLYRHAAVLEDTEIQASLCYSYHIARIILQAATKYNHHYNYTINHLDAVNVSLEKIALFNVRRPSAASLTIQGILEAQIGLFTTALDTFEKASSLTSVPHEVSSLERNKIGVLKELGRYSQVLEHIQRFTQDELNLSILASKALALEKTGEFELAYAAYESLLPLCSTDLQKSNVLISLGLVSNRIHGLDTAKTLLFQGCGVSDTPDGYAALCSLALLAGDLRLAGSVVEKMEKKFQKQKHIHMLGLMKSFAVVAAGGDGGQALKGILSLLHKYPLSGKLWKVLGNHFINFQSEGRLGRRALAAASLLGTEATLPAIALTFLLEGDLERALKEAQKGLFQNPHSLPAITAIVVTLSTRDELDPLADFGLKMAKKGLRMSQESAGENGWTKESDSGLHQEALRNWLASYIQQKSQ